MCSAMLGREAGAAPITKVAGDISFWHGRAQRLAPSAHHERIGAARARVDPHALGLQVLVDRLGAVLAPQPRVFIATEWRHETDRAIGIDPDRAGLEPLRHAKRAADVRCPDSRAEPEGHA